MGPQAALSQRTPGPAGAVQRSLCSLVAISDVAPENLNRQDANAPSWRFVFSPSLFRAGDKRTKTGRLRGILRVGCDAEPGRSHPLTLPSRPDARLRRERLGVG